MAIAAHVNECTAHQVTRTALTEVTEEFARFKADVALTQLHRVLCSFFFL
eukprot:m.293654 g.293654  ORF g.293654 m.293654 type:complete len:50 (+) comp55125_c0_seq24:1114-1263(+)